MKMKKIITISSILTLLTVVSCNKTHVCSCNTTLNTNGVVDQYPVVDSVINNVSTSEANELCNSKDRQFTQGGGTTTINCELK